MIVTCAHTLQAIFKVSIIAIRKRTGAGMCVRERVQQNAMYQEALQEALQEGIDRKEAKAKALAEVRRNSAEIFIPVDVPGLVQELMRSWKNALEARRIHRANSFSARFCLLWESRTRGRAPRAGALRSRVHPAQALASQRPQHLVLS